MTCEIPLSKGKWALVDDEDYDYLMQFNWCVAVVEGGKQSYAVRSTPRDENYKQQVIRMHRVVMNCPDGMEVDHINHNGLDNRKCNLRLCNCVENSFNRTKMHKSNPPISRYKGVYWRKNRNKWHVRIQANGKREYVGMYNDEIEAAKAYDEAAKKYHGEFAYLNFPE